MKSVESVDRHGEMATSARQPGVTETILEGLAHGEETEGRREVVTLALLCAAWQSMEEAEAMSSSERYAEAGGNFNRAVDSATSERISILARGHAAYCDAIRLSTEFRAKLDPTSYRQTKELLEVAVDCYARAGAQSGALWARATEHIVDGLVYSGRAESELEIKAKTRLYALSERSFDTAVKLYEEAHVTIRQAQAEQYLQTTRQKARIFTSTMEVLEAPFLQSSQVGAVAPRGLSRDQPIDTKRSESANLQGDLTLSRSELRVGETVVFTLRLVSTGRSPAVLLKLTELASSESLAVEPVEGDKYQLEDGAVNFRGLRLDPYETLEIGFRVGPSRPGEFIVQPSVLYLDENGRFQRYQLNRSSFKALRGTRVLEFENPGAKKVFDCLVAAFVEDYDFRKLYLEQSGWKSLTWLAKTSKIPHATLYGKRGRHGPQIHELLSKGLIEKRILIGQRGRGGEVVKVRISFAKEEEVKRYVDASMHAEKF